MRFSRNERDGAPIASVALSSDLKHSSVGKACCLLHLWAIPRASKNLSSLGSIRCFDILLAVFRVTGALAIFEGVRSSIAVLA
ncbi:MAG: hypothetical protein DBX97_00635 [Collinsella tanakaei]|nr:MAG: hypothetical protein DBX97_00635 [Collinsella tanakaei]